MYARQEYTVGFQSTDDLFSNRRTDLTNLTYIIKDIFQCKMLDPPFLQYVDVVSPMTPITLWRFH